MKLRVLVKDKQIDVQCGDGKQQVKWLANVALCRYDTSLGVELGIRHLLFILTHTLLLVVLSLIYTCHRRHRHSHILTIYIYTSHL